MPFTDANGISLYYEVHGDGIPLILIPGYTQDSRCWQAYIEPFSSHFKLILFDPRGAGQSEAPAEPYTIELFATDVIALMDILDLESAHLMGQSMGTLISQRLCIDHPDRIRKAVLCAPFAHLPPVSLNHGLQLLNLLNTGVAREHLLRLNASWLFSNQFVAQKGNVDQFVGEIMKAPYPQTPEGLQGQAHALFSADLRSELHKIPHETLLLVGGEDILTPPFCAEILQKAIPRCTTHTFPKMAHMLNYEVPEHVTKHVLKFLIE